MSEVQDFVLFTVKYGDINVYVQKDGPGISYEEVITLAKKEFEIPPETEVVLYDTNGALIKQKIFCHWVLKNEQVGPFEIKLKDEDKSGKPILIEIPPDDTSEVSSEVSESSGSYQTLQDQIRKIIKQKLESELRSVYDEYQSRGFLTESNKRKLVEVMCLEMNKFFKDQFNHPLPTNEDRKEWAMATVHILPKLKDPFTPCGYEVFWDPKTRKGLYANKFKNSFRKNCGIIDRGTYKPKNPKNSSGNENKKPKIDNEHKESEEDEETEENDEDVRKTKEAKIKEEIERVKNIPAVKYMLTARPQTHLIQIREKMHETFECRRDLVKNSDLSKYIFEVFPRFLDVEDLIIQDFERLHQNTQFKTGWMEIADAVWKVYESRGPFIDECRDSTEGTTYNLETRKFIALILMLQKGVRGKTKIEIIKHFIDFCQVGSPLQEGVFNVPHIVAEGEKKSSIDNYWLSIDHRFISLGPDLLTAVDAYFKSFFVFHIAYPCCLKNFLDFLEVAMFSIKGKEKISTVVKEIWASIKAVKDE